MNVILFDAPEIRTSLLPLTFTRPTAEIRIGILTISQKWAKHLQTEVSYFTEEYLQDKFPLQTSEDNFWINGAACPTAELAKKIASLEANTKITFHGKIIAARSSSNLLDDLASLKEVVWQEEITIIDERWKIFKKNAEQLRIDFQLITDGRTSAPLTDPYTAVYNKEDIFIEEGATIKAAVLNAENGPIYIGKNAQVGEGAIIRGSFALGEGAIVNVGAKIRGDTTIGPYCKVGGEVSNSVLFGYSNKGHEGFIGNTIVGEWCNFGADTNTSNLKNNYGDVQTWNYASDSFTNTGQTFCGLVMGDHSKCSINTMFNTGTVVGVSANIFGAGFPSKFIPSFSWGGAESITSYQLEKANEVASKVMGRRNIDFNEIERKIFEKVFELTAKYRNWEK